MIHLDIKKLGRFEQIGHRITGDRRGQSNRRARGEGSGWEFVHICIDDASRVAFSQILPDERADSAVPFLKAAVAYYASLGVAVTGQITRYLNRTYRVLATASLLMDDNFRRRCEARPGSLLPRRTIATAVA
jgi:hypothetical protein